VALACVPIVCIVVGALVCGTKSKKNSAQIQQVAQPGVAAVAPASTVPTLTTEQQIAAAEHAELEKLRAAQEHEELLKLRAAQAAAPQPGQVPSEGP
jgi:hypothetical protein